MVFTIVKHGILRDNTWHFVVRNGIKRISV